MSKKFLKTDITTSQSLPDGTLSYTTTLTQGFKLEQVTFHASENITETVTVTLDSGEGANYDVVLASSELSSAQDYVFRPTGELNLQAGDNIKVQCTNANTTGTMYVTIKTSEL